MSDPSIWSVSVGRWSRVHIRVHALFLAVAVGMVFLCTRADHDEGIGLGLLSVAVLLGSVLAHELGHYLAALRAGSTADQIVLGPLGGLVSHDVARQREAELVVAVAGPAVNFAILLAVLPILWALDIGVGGLLSPLEPVDLLGGPWWAATLKLTFWINWMLLGANLLPAFPLDGARLLRALLWPALDYRSAGHVAARASKLTALGIVVLAWFVRDIMCASVLPMWVPLVLLSVFVYFSAQQEVARLDEGDWDEELFNYDFSQGYTSLERGSDASGRPRPSLRRWLYNRREVRRRRRLSLEQAEEREVDEILLRLHESGMQGLTAKERALLNRVSARYRNRQSN